MVKIPKIKKVTLTIDCRDSFIDKYARELSVSFELKDNILVVKPTTRKKEVGRFEQITLADFLMENDNIPGYAVYSSHTDLYRISLDYDTINELYNEQKGLTVEDLCLCNQWLHKNKKKAFYSLCLANYDELPDIHKKTYEEGIDYDFIALENSIVYPFSCDYKITINPDG
jgi:hypothetical protein